MDFLLKQTQYEKPSCIAIEDVWKNPWVYAILRSSIPLVYWSFTATDGHKLVKENKFSVVALQKLIVKSASCTQITIITSENVESCLYRLLLCGFKHNLENSFATNRHFTTSPSSTAMFSCRPTRKPVAAMIGNCVSDKISSVPWIQLTYL